MCLCTSEVFTPSESRPGLLSASGFSVSSRNFQFISQPAGRIDQKSLLSLFFEGNRPQCSPAPSPESDGIREGESKGLELKCGSLLLLKLDYYRFTRSRELNQRRSRWDADMLPRGSRRHGEAPPPLITGDKREQIRFRSSFCGFSQHGGR